MKARHKFAAYFGGAGLLTLSAILYLVRSTLLAIGPWVLAAILALTGMVLAYGVYSLYCRFHAKYHIMASRRVELHAREQQLRIEAERAAIEHSLMLLQQQHLATRIYPDSKGYMPTVISIDEAQGYNYIQLPHPAHAGRAQSNPQLRIDEHSENTSGSLPTSVRYEDIRSHVPPGHALLGVSGHGVETKEFGAFKTMLICGGSDSGKSNTVALKIDEAIRLGRNVQLIVIDWHAYKPDSLTNKIKPYTSRLLLPVVTEEDETVGVLEHFLGLYQERRAAMKEAALSGRELLFDDILLVCDEVPEMLDSGIPQLKETLNQVAKICGRSARGFGLFGWFICQNMIGMSSIRNYAHTIIGHKPVMLNERKMVANGHADIASDMENWPKGRIVVYGQSFEGTLVTQMALFSTPSRSATTRIVEADLDEMEPLQPRSTFRVNESNRNSETERVSASETNGQAASELSRIIVFPVSSQAASVSEKKETSNVSDETKKTIARMHRSGMPMREIAKMVGLSGEKYTTFKLACQELGIAPIQQGEAQ